MRLDAPAPDQTPRKAWIVVAVIFVIAVLVTALTVAGLLALDAL